VMAVEIKRKAPTCHTVLEVVNVSVLLCVFIGGGHGLGVGWVCGARRTAHTCHTVPHTSRVCECFLAGEDVLVAQWGGGVLFAVMAVEIKRKAPTCHTVLEVVNVSVLFPLFFGARVRSRSFSGGGGSHTCHTVLEVVNVRVLFQLFRVGGGGRRFWRQGGVCQHGRHRAGPRCVDAS
jgi:hypothetical protein